MEMHNVEKLQEILNRIMQGIVNMITSAITCSQELLTIMMQSMIATYMLQVLVTVAILLTIRIPNLY